MNFRLSPSRSVRPATSVIVPIIVVLGCMAVAVPACAHVIYEDSHVYSSDYDCTWNRAEISHSGGGYAKSDVTANVKGLIVRITCYDDFPRPARHLKNRYKLYLKSGSDWDL